MKELAQFQERLQRELSAFFRRKRREVSRVNKTLLPLFDHGVAFTLRKDSKRIRPFLFVVGHRMLGGRTTPAIMRLAVVFELIQSHLLIHDDIMDRDTVRRGGPTVHVALRKECPNGHDGVHYGESQAILLGSLFGIWAREEILHSSVALPVRQRLLDHVESIIATTHYGQMLDVRIGESNSASRKDILTVYRFKTARYTITGPLQCGAILAGATIESLRAIERYGLPVGIAFQMVNDIKGLFQNGDQHDNTGTSDLAEGKKTIILDDALRNLAGTDRKKLAALLATRPTTKKEVGATLSLIDTSGAVETCRATARRLLQKGKHALTGQRGFAIKDVRLLCELAGYILQQVSSL